MKELRELGHIMALAHHEPNKIKDSVKSTGEIKDQAAQLGLETEQWW